MLLLLLLVEVVLVVLGNLLLLLLLSVCGSDDGGVGRGRWSVAVPEVEVSCGCCGRRVAVAVSANEEEEEEEDDTGGQTTTSASEEDAQDNVVDVRRVTVVKGRAPKGTAPGLVVAARKREIKARTVEGPYKP